MSAAGQTSTEDDLSKAFERPGPPKQFEPERNVPPPPLPDDPNAQLRADFERDLAAAQKRFDAGAGAELRADLTLVELSGVFLGERVRVARLQRALAERLADKKAMREADTAWLGACGPTGATECRAAALAHIETYDAPAAQKARTADGCLAAAERNAGQPTPACLDAALAVYRKANDVMMVARVELLRAQVLAADRKQVKAARAALTRLAALPDDRRSLVRRTALETLSRLDLADGAIDSAVKNALQASAAWAAALPPEQRPWARSPALDPACEAYDKGKSAGACRALEKRMLAGYVFHDFSDQHLGEGELLSHDMLVTVNEQYNVLVRDCLSREIDSLDRPEAFAYRVRWLVISNGHVDNFHSDSTQEDQSRFVTCLRNQFGYWRYPRHEGDPQRIEQTFTVRSATHSFEETEE